jgi:uncharacterized protein (DUF1501 family)
MSDFNRASHSTEHAGATQHNPLRPAAADLIRVGSRRWFLQTGLAGLAGISVPALLRCRAQSRAAAAASRKAVILIWLSGGPSQLDTWDPKPDAPSEIRGPFGSIATRVPGVRLCEHLPLQARILDRLALIRSVDCRASTDHYPAPMQAGNALAQRSRVGSSTATHPSMGSLAARFRGANDPALPAFVGLADPPLWLADVLGAGPLGGLGGACEPVRGDEMIGRLNLPRGVSVPQAQDRARLCQQLDSLRRDLDVRGTMDRMDHYRQQALDIVLSGKAQQAFRVDLEPQRLRDAYGRHSLGERTLLARRLVEAGVTFVTVSGTFGVFDNHGDDVVWGGLIRGLQPLLPRLDQAVYALVTDLEARGLLDDTLVLVLGEFGRTPVVTPTGGRSHHFDCMSMLVAGGRARGQVIGSTDARGSEVKEAPVTPADLGATVFRHLGIDLASQWIDPQGRPQSIVTEGGRPIPELS